MRNIFFGWYLCSVLFLGTHSVLAQTDCASNDHVPDNDLTISGSCSFPGNKVYTYKSIVITSSGRVTMNDGAVLAAVNSLTLHSGGIIYANQRIQLIANTTMDIFGTIDGAGRGYASDQAPSYIDQVTSSSSGNGGSHSGIGHGDFITSRSTSYGSYLLPKTMVVSYSDVI